MVDNETEPIVPLVSEHCEFGDHRGYICMAIARSKENEQLDGNEVVFREIITDEESTRHAVRKLRALADGYVPDEQGELTMRLYVSVNARDLLDTYWRYRDRMAGWVEDHINGDEHAAPKFGQIDTYWYSQLQRPEVAADSYFLIDVDGSDGLGPWFDELFEDTDVMKVRKTPNGYHVVTEPFQYPNADYLEGNTIEVKTDAMLYVTRLGEIRNTDVNPEK